MIDKPTRLVPNKHYKKEVLMMCDKQDIIDYCHEMEQRLFQSMLIIDKLIERKELNENDEELLEKVTQIVNQSTLVKSVETVEVDEEEK